MPRDTARSALLLAMLALTGCIGNDVATGGSPVDQRPPTEALALERIVRIDDDSFQGEPSLAVTPGGTLFTQTRTSLFRSTDDGATWEEQPLPIHGIAADPHLTSGPDGSVWFSAMMPPYLCHQVAESRDLGETWSTNPVVCPEGGGDRQYVIAIGDGQAFMAYHRSLDLDVVVLETQDHGATWATKQAPVLPFEAQGEPRSFWFGNSVRNTATGTLLFPFTWYRHPSTPPPTCEGQNCYEDWAPGALLSRDGGRTWIVTVGPEATGEPLGVSLVRGAADHAGTLYLTWASTHDGSVAVWLTVSTDDGRTWSPARRIDTSAHSKAFPSISAGAPGHVSVAYYRADTPGHPGSLPEEASWTVELAWTETATRAWPSWHRGNLSDVPVKHGAICVDGAVCKEDREFLDYLALQSMPDGRVASVYNVLPEGGDSHTDLENRFALTREPLLAP